MKNIILNSIGFWLIIFSVILPFPYYLIEPIFNISSDSVILYWIALITITFSILIAILCARFFESKKTKIDSILRVITTYVLSFFLLKYGIDKLLLHQFYTPNPNTLFTPTGEMTKDILFWTSMGTSKTYNWFMAIIEILPGLLLLHSKTRELGTLIAFGVLLNVFMVNIGFDISVKLFSLYLLINSIYLIQPIMLKLIRFLVAKENTKLTQRSSIFSASPLSKRLIKSSLLFLFALEIGLPYFNQTSQKNEFVGAYNVKSPEIFLGHSLKRIYIHRENYFIIENIEGKFHDYKSTITGNYLYVIKAKVGFQIHKHESTTEFRIIRDNDVKSIKTTQIDLNKLPLMDDDFHWTVEGILKSNLD